MTLPAGFSTASLLGLAGLVLALLALLCYRLNRRLRAEVAALRAGRLVMESTIDNMAEALIVTDPELRLSRFNQRFADITGFDVAFLAARPHIDEVLRRWVGENTLPDALLERSIRRARSREPFHHTFTHHGRRFEGRHVPLPGGGFVRTISDVTERHQTDALLRASEARLRRLLELAPVAIVVIARADARILLANRRAQALAGRREEEMRQSHLQSLYSDQAELARLHQALERDGEVSAMEARFRRHGGEEYWALISAVRGEFGGQDVYIAAVADITARKLMEKRLEEAHAGLEEVNLRLREANAELAEAASTDQLTGLANRRHMEAEAVRELTRAVRYRHPLSVVLFDVDWFKLVNDRLGHETGDRVLREVAARVLGQLRASDIVARWGGEEFLVLAPEAGMLEAIALAEKLRRILAEGPFEGAGRQSASFGVAQFDGRETFSALVGRADCALYRAKAEGRNRVKWDLTIEQDRVQLDD